MKSTMTTMTATLTVLAVAVAAILAGVKELTDKPIAEARERALTEALEAVLPAFDNIDRSTTPDGFTVYTATSGGRRTGVAVETFSGKGFGGTIRLLAGFDDAGTLRGYRVLEHAETPGLGANMGRWFMAEGTTHNVVGTTGPLAVRADGGDIDAITGATITSRAFMEAVNTARAATGFGEAPADAHSGASEQKHHPAPAAADAQSSEQQQ